MPTQAAIGQEIITVASHFLGLYETRANAQWDNPNTLGVDPEGLELQALLSQVGWQPGWAYCAAFCEAVWRTAYLNLKAPAPLLERIARTLTPSVIRSYANAGGDVGNTPAPGAIFFMELGHTGKGHAGIVVRASGAGALARMATIEGNTSPEPDDPNADREGDGICRRLRAVNFKPKSGLWLRGFLPPYIF